MLEEARSRAESWKAISGNTFEPELKARCDARMYRELQEVQQLELLLSTVRP